MAESTERQNSSSISKTGSQSDEKFTADKGKYFMLCPMFGANTGDRMGSGMIILKQ